MVGDTILIKDISINGNNKVTGGLNTATSDQLSKTLTDNTINSLGIDASSRTIWINGQPYGNAYVNIKEDNTVEAPIGAEIFNDFEHNTASGDYSHASGFYTKTTNIAEAAFGQFNQSTEGSTIFSIGDGDSDSSRHNIVEVTDNNVNINTNLNVEDNLIVDENATIEGTLGVTGKTTVSTLESTGNVDLESLDVTNNTTIGGTLGVTDNTTIGGTLGVTGKTTVSTLESTGNVDLESLDVTNNTTIGGTLGVTGNTTIKGNIVGENNLRIIGETSLENKVAAGEGALVTNDSEIAVGRFNKSNKNSDNYGDEGNTAFSIGIGESDNTRKNTVEVMQNGNVYINGIGGYTGENPSDSKDLATYLPNMVNITYTDLKKLRDRDQLVPGQQYRITDYVCTTNKIGTRPADHQFDIIVTADDESTLNETARAINHPVTEDETDYFYNNDLNAWKIWYCLDNDTDRFAWADNSNNGRGVIYRMIDEWNNDVPYDFKNIIYTVKQSFIFKQLGNYYLFNRDTSIDIQNINGKTYYGYITEVTPLYWAENKCWITEDNPNIYSKLYNSNGIGIVAVGNIIKVISDNYETYTFGKTSDLSKDGNCYNNTILPCYSSGILMLNIDTFNDKCHYNSLGKNCYFNTFKDDCYNNSLGNNCCDNTIGTSCHYNSFGIDCLSNSFGKYCEYNSFGNECSDNTFGNYCRDNTFGNGCYGNLFENHCYYNTFGNNCYYINFTSNIESDKDIFCNNNSVGSGCKYITFIANGTSASPVQNYSFTQGLKGELNNPLEINGSNINKPYETKVAKNSKGELKIYCEADSISNF